MIISCSARRDGPPPSSIAFPYLFVQALGNITRQHFRQLRSVSGDLSCIYPALVARNSPLLFLPRCCGPAHHVKWASCCGLATVHPPRIFHLLDLRRNDLQHVKRIRRILLPHHPFSCHEFVFVFRRAACRDAPFVLPTHSASLR